MKGNPIALYSTSGSTTWCYDRRGNVTQKTQVTNGTTRTTSYTYTTAAYLDDTPVNTKKVTYIETDYLGTPKQVIDPATNTLYRT